MEALKAEILPEDTASSSKAFRISTDICRNRGGRIGGLCDSQLLLRAAILTIGVGILGEFLDVILPKLLHN